MTSNVAALAIGAFVVLLAGTGSPSAQQGQLPWQTSWSVFIEALGPVPGPESMRAYRQFEGRVVTWEGVVGPSTDGTFALEMTPSAALGYDVSLQVTPREVTRWTSLAVGSHVRFKGSVAAVFPVKVTRAGRTTTTAAVFVKDAELVDVSN